MPSLYDKMLQKSVKESQSTPPAREIDTSTSYGQTKNADQSYKNLAVSTNSENKETSLQENKKTSFLVSKETVKQVKQETSKRGTYPKVTYQLNPLIIDMLEDAKITLKRQHDIKATLADIVEEAIEKACIDLQENKKTSFLVFKLTSNQGSK